MPSSAASPSRFAPAPITCPGCHRELPGPVDQCPHCAYNAWTCVDRFPYSPPPLERYIDVESRLSNEDRARIDRAVDALESELPQVRVYVCVVKLLAGTDARECGFWMLNASIPRDEEETSHRPWSVLLLIDTGASAASATVGYGLDPFITDTRLYAALQNGRADWEHGNFAAGILKFIHHVHQTLKQAHRDAVKAVRNRREPPPPPPPERMAPSAPPPARHPES